MSRNRDTARVEHRAREILSVQHSVGQVVSLHDSGGDAEQKEVAEVGVGLDALEHRDPVTLRQFSVEAIDFAVAGEEPMLGEADSTENIASAAVRFKVLLRRDV